MKNKILAIALCALLAVSLAACGGSGGAEESAPEANGAQAATSAGAEAEAEESTDAGKKQVTVFTKKHEWNWEKIEEEFEKAYPDHDLIVDITEANTYYDILKTYLATEDMPDVIQIVPGATLQLWSEHLVDISDLQAFGHISEDIYKDYYLGDQCLGVPLFAEYHGAIYNMEHLNAAGIEAVPETLDEFIEMNTKLEAAGVPMGVAAWKDTGAIVGHMTAGIFGNQDDPLQYYHDIRDGKIKLMDEPLWNGLLDYLDAVRQYGNPDALNTDNTTERNAMYAGQYAWYAHDGSWVTPAMRTTNPDMEQNMQMGVYPFTNNAEDNVIGLSTQGLSIMNTDHVEEAKLFVDWLLGSDEGAEIMVKECNVVLMRDDYEMTVEDIGALSVQGQELTKAGKAGNNFRNISDEAMSEMKASFQKYIAEALTREETLAEIEQIISRES